jgi:hypothetical protein
MKKIKKFILPLSFTVALILTVLNFISCQKDPPVGDGSECSYCNVNSDCKDGMTCELFTNNNAANFKSALKCAATSYTTCPI